MLDDSKQNKTKTKAQMRKVKRLLISEHDLTLYLQGSDGNYDKTSVKNCVGLSLWGWVWTPDINYPVFDLLLHLSLSSPMLLS